MDKAAEKKLWYVLIWAITIIFLTGFVLLSVLLTKFYMLCDENKAIVVINIVASVLLIVLTVIPGLGRGG